MSGLSDVLPGHLACVIAGLGAGGVAMSFAAVPPVAAPLGGRRAAQRRRWLRAMGALSGLDLLLRRLATLVRPVVSPLLRARIDERLEQAGEVLGLGADELVVVTVLGGAFGGVLAWAACGALGFGSAGLAFGIALGAALPSARLSAEADARKRAADRELPGAIDLIAMCMAAGLDFPRAVRLVADNPIGGAVLPVELGRVLADIELGSTRRVALERLARRLPSRGVRDFVAAAVQAEQKGTPLSVVLAAQAGMSRMRRSVAAEEAASRAGVLLMVPLMMLMVCVVLLLVGPFIAGGGLR